MLRQWFMHMPIFVASISLSLCRPAMCYAMTSTHTLTQDYFTYFLHGQLFLIMARTVKKFFFLLCTKHWVVKIAVSDDKDEAWLIRYTWYHCLTKHGSIIIGDNCSEGGSVSSEQKVMSGHYYERKSASGDSLKCEQASSREWMNGDLSFCSWVSIASTRAFMKEVISYKEQ